jgi:thiol-disulfide isomerase/thioredoxin
VLSSQNINQDGTAKVASSQTATLARGLGAAVGALGLAALFLGEPAGQISSRASNDAPAPTSPQGEPQKSSGRDPAASWKTAAPSPGWHWLAKPEQIEGSIPESNFARAYLSDKAVEPSGWSVVDGELVISLPPMSDSSYELVVFNRQGERASIPVRTRDTQSLGFFVNAIPQVHAIGIQYGPAAELQRLAERTYELATEAGLHVLPPRILNQPYDFSLANVDGGLIQGQELKGKVVVMYEWATWCMSCHAYMKELFPLVERYGSAVQFIAIDHDDISRAEMARGEMKKFPAGTLHTAAFANQAAAPDGNHPLVKDFSGTWWMSRLGLRSAGIPRVIIVGREGELAFDDSAPAAATLGRLIEKELHRPQDAPSR